MNPHIKLKKKNKWGINVAWFSSSQCEDYLLSIKHAVSIMKPIMCLEDNDLILELVYQRGIFPEDFII
jgi:hypothetical protein